jgi:hypothetical protein
MLLAAVPVVSLGTLALVPSLVIAIRHRNRTNWIACAVFTAVTVGWICQLTLTAETTHGLQFLSDVLLLLVSTLGATAHSLLNYPSPLRITGAAA